MKLNTITEYTDREWPADHPLRRISSVIADDAIGRAKFLVCTLVAEERQPPGDGDCDVLDACCKCSTGIVRRASAPQGPKPICWKCWQALP